MAKRTRLSSLVVSGQAEFLAKLLNNGFIDIYDGQQPEDADEEITDQRLGVTLQFGSPAFLPPVKGVISANLVRSGVAVAELKKATWARLYREDHKTKVMDVSVGERDANILLPTTHLVRGVTVSCSSFVHSIAKKSMGV